MYLFFVGKAGGANENFVRMNFLQRTKSILGTYIFLYDKEKRIIMKKNSMAYDTAVYSLWFGLNYGSILTACALYKTLEQYGKTPGIAAKAASSLGRTLCGKG